MRRHGAVVEAQAAGQVAIADSERRALPSRWARAAAVMAVLVSASAAVGFALAETWAPDEGAGGQLVATAGEAGGQPVSEPVPSTHLDRLGEGPPVAFSDYRGSPLLVNFWASWCVPCVTEMPELQAIAEAADDGHLALLGVNVQDAPTNATNFARELGISYDLVVDATASLFAEIGGFGLPTTLLVDPEGTIVYRHVGIMDRGEIADAIAEHLGVQVDPAPKP